MQGIIDNAYERSISRCDRDSFASIHNRTVVYEKIVSDSFARRPPYRLPLSFARCIVGIRSPESFEVRGEINGR